MKKAIFFDRDGVINIDKHHVYKVEDFIFYKDVFKAIPLLSKFFLKIIVTNQAGIAKKLYTEKDFTKLTKWMLKELKSKKITINKVYHCPHYENCSCRKPKPGMIKAAAKDLNIDLKQSWLIGDKETDIIAGKKAGCKTILLTRTKNIHKKTLANFEVKTLLQAVKIIDKFGS